MNPNKPREGTRVSLEGRLCREEEYTVGMKGVFGNFSFYFLRFPFKLQVFEERSLFDEIKSHMRMLRVHGHRR